jgi:hypothetical protein
MSQLALGPGPEVEGTSGAVKLSRFRERLGEAALQGSSRFGVTSWAN